MIYKKFFSRKIKISYLLLLVFTYTSSVFGVESSEDLDEKQANAVRIMSEVVGHYKYGYTLSEPQEDLVKQFEKTGVSEEDVLKTVNLVYKKQGEWSDYKIRILADFIPLMSRLQKLVINCGLDGAEIERLVEGLNSSKYAKLTLRFLDLQKNKMGERGAKAVAQINIPLHHLWLQGRDGNTGNGLGVTA